MANYINQNGMAFSVIEEVDFGVTPTTGTRYDLLSMPVRHRSLRLSTRSQTTLSV